MTLFSPSTDDRRRRIVAPGAVHLPGCLDRDQQRALVDAFHGWANGPVPIRAAELPNGRRMSVKTVCLGWHWQPYKYTRTADDLNGREVLALPAWLAELGRGVLADAYGPESAQRWHPDAALVNYYDGTARLGMHQDKEEIVDEPVVSLSVGDSCRFRFGNTENRASSTRTSSSPSATPSCSDASRGLPTTASLAPTPAPPTPPVAWTQDGSTSRCE